MCSWVVADARQVSCWRAGRRWRAARWCCPRARRARWQWQAVSPHLTRHQCRAQSPSSPPPPAGADVGAPLVLPSRSVDGATPHTTVRGFVAGASTAATPPGTDICVLHLSCPGSSRGARADLEPVLSALATLPGGDTTDAPPGRPRALLVAFHTGPPPVPPADLQTGLPANVSVVPGPSGGAAACDGAVAAAATVLIRLYGAEVPLLPSRPPDADTSDEEAADELEAVLGELGL